MRNSGATKKGPESPSPLPFKWRPGNGWTILSVLEQYDKRRLKEHDRVWWSAWRNGLWVALSAALIPGVVAVWWLWVQ